MRGSSGGLLWFVVGWGVFAGLLITGCDPSSIADPTGLVIVTPTADDPDPPSTVLGEQETAEEYPGDTDESGTPPAAEPADDDPPPPAAPPPDVVPDVPRDTPADPPAPSDPPDDPQPPEPPTTQPSDPGGASPPADPIQTAYDAIDQLWLARQAQLGRTGRYLLTPQQLQADFDYIWGGSRAEWLAYAGTGYACWYYFHQYIVAALTSMYRTTGQPEYLADAQYIADLMVDLATDDPARIQDSGDGYYSWPISESMPRESVLQILQPARALTNVARTLAASGLDGWQKYHDFVVANVVNRFNLLQVTPDMNTSFERPCHVIVLLSDLAAVNNLPAYRQAVADWAAALRTSHLHAQADGQGYWWHWYADSQDDICDTSHGHRVPDAFDGAFRLGCGISSDDIDVLKRGFLLKMWLPSPTNPFLWSNLVDGSNPALDLGSTVYAPYRAGSVGLGWSQLARYDERVRKLCELLADAIMRGDTRLNEAGYADKTLYARLTLASVLLEIQTQQP